MAGAIPEPSKIHSTVLSYQPLHDVGPGKTSKLTEHGHFATLYLIIDLVISKAKECCDGVYSVTVVVLPTDGGLGRSTVGREANRYPR